MAWYKTGTVAVTNASTTVTGAGTNFVSGAQVGDGFLGPNELLYEITAINSATSLTIAPAYGGATASSQSYAIAPTQGLVASLASDVTDLITDYQSVVDNAGAGKFGDGSAASPAIRFTNDQDTGFFRDTANEIAFATAGVKRGEFSSSGIQLLDSQKFIAGTGSDLQIFSDGTKSYLIESGSGDLELRATDFVVKNAGNTKIMASFNDGGTVQLRYDNEVKLATTSAGVDVTGSITLDHPTAQNISFTNTAANPTISSVRALNIDIDSDGNQGTTAINFTHDGGAGTIATFSETGDISFYEDTGTTPKFFWDASAESLGIGRTPRTRLEIASGNSGGNAGLDAPVFRITNTTLSSDWDSGDVNGKIEFYSDDDSGNSPYDTAFIQSEVDINNGTLPSGALVFGTATYNAVGGAVERMRIDSSGNLLVGTTGTIDISTTSVTGHDLRSSGSSVQVRDGGIVQYLNRLTSDGDIVQLRKDGATVGSIGTNAGSPYFKTTGGGFRIAGNGALQPATSTGAVSDALEDLGSSGGRWKDLYLSGGVYLGGTGSDNKLDEFEEGVYIPTLTCGTSGSITINIGYDDLAYTKIGNTVHVHGRIRISSASSPSGTADLSLPFTSANLAGDAGRVSGVCYLQNAANNMNEYALHPTVEGNAYVQIGRMSGGAFATSIANEFSGNELLFVSITYRAA